MDGFFYHEISMAHKTLRRRIEDILGPLGLLRPVDWSTVDMTFIVSTGRTGTRFFGRFFDAFEGVYARHEPKPDMVGLGVEYAAGRVSFQRAAGVIEANRRAIGHEVKRRGASVYVESNNRFFSLLKPLRSVFPHARIVHVVRDGRDYVRSGLGREWYTGKDRFPRLTASMFPDDPWHDRWNTMDRFEKIAWRWQKKDSILSDDMADLDNTLTVRFEDIFTAPDRPGLFEITRFLGFTDSEVATQLQHMGSRKMNATQNPPLPPWAEWDTDLVERFDRIAGKHLRRCGYSE